MTLANTYEHVRSEPPKQARQRGIALVVVLWLLVLMTVIAASHARVIRTETRLASNQVESGKARSLAEAGVHHAILELLVRESDQRWPVNGSVNRIRYEDGSVAIAIRDVRGLLDINKAPAALLDSVLAGTGMEEGQRQALVDAILDWRDKDNLKHANGAEDDDYRRAGLKWAARDGAFSSVEEFRYVMGMTNPLFERLAPYLTVYSGQTTIKLDYAPPWLISVLSETLDTQTTVNPAGQEMNSTFRITVWATSNGGSTTSLDAVVRITARNDPAYTILSWRDPARSIIPAAS
jgi:general secretion pathway protein K